MEKKLKPAFRENKRYLLIQGGSKESIEKAILDFLGVLGYAKASPQFIQNNKGVILAINREELDSIRASLVLAKEQVRVLKVSGTLKGLLKSSTQHS